MESSNSSSSKRSKLYLFAAASYLINMFIEALLVSDSGANQLANSPYSFVSSSLFPVYVTASAALMVFFYYRRYVYKKRHPKACRRQAMANVVIHLIHPVLFALFSTSALFPLYDLFMIFCDCLFLIKNPGRSSKTVMGDYISVAGKIFAVADAILCPVFLSLFIFGMGMDTIYLTVAFGLIILSYFSMFFQYLSY